MGVMKRKIPYEIKSYKSTMFFGLTTRQLICLILMLALAVPTGIFGNKIMSSDTVGYIIMIEVIPFAAVGWLSYNDMPLEQIALRIFRFYVGTQKRKWIFNSPETLIHNEEVRIEYLDAAVERAREIAEEKYSGRFRKHRKSRKGSVNNAD